MLQSFGGRGMVTFYVSEPYCAFIELLRDGDGISEHLRRLEPGGLYEPLLSDTGISNGEYACSN
jgi:hypothetical protein